MWVKRLWRWTVGEVRFCAEGGLCERFLNLLSEADDPIRLWDVVFEEGAVTASCRVSDYRRLRPFARRTGTRVRHIYARGLMKTTAPLRRRSGLIVGALCAAAVYLYLASFIWVVEIDVADAVLRDTIETELAACGVGIGEPMKAVDVPYTRMKMIAAVPQIHHLSLSFKGSVVKAAVTLGEEDIVLPDKTPTNIVAARDGLIVSMRVSSGQKIAKVGEAVTAGDLLVCGAIETTKGVLLRHSEAVVTAQTTYTLETTAHREETVLETAREYTLPTLRFLNISLPLYSSGDTFDGWQQTTHRQELSLFGTTLPVGLYRTVCTEQVDKTVIYSKEEMKTLAHTRMEELLSSTLDGKEIVSVEYDEHSEEDVYRLTAHCTVLEDIALEQPLLINTE